MSRLLRTDDSRDDLTAIWPYIAQDNSVAADRLIDEIDRTPNLLFAFPLLGESVEHLRPETRRIMLGHYQAFYEVVPDGIRLLRVNHASRRIEDLFS
jgi:toxin ParE1/3/4